jgi:hypothetical protein
MVSFMAGRQAGRQAGRLGKVRGVSAAVVLLVAAGCSSKSSSSTTTWDGSGPSPSPVTTSLAPASTSTTVARTTTTTLPDEAIKKLAKDRLRETLLVYSLGCSEKFGECDTAPWLMDEGPWPELMRGEIAKWKKERIFTGKSATSEAYINVEDVQIADDHKQVTISGCWWDTGITYRMVEDGFTPGGVRTIDNDSIVSSYIDAVLVPYNGTYYVQTLKFFSEKEVIGENKCGPKVD